MNGQIDGQMDITRWKCHKNVFVQKALGAKTVISHKHILSASNYILPVYGEIYAKSLYGEIPKIHLQMGCKFQSNMYFWLCLGTSFLICPGRKYPGTAKNTFYSQKSIFRWDVS